ncbi:hypothetical protein CSOJ01_03185 [Colletotrichum sojae]|uniref:Uncharacterized protein n=1 Tax=Colletotrichum sojae TaxID=2175907 RepID=A0A8H6N0T3_9PEZI|nr:hypothetical protein CSOJ01_03185 [Colletotrichum sojae]
MTPFSRSYSHSNGNPRDTELCIAFWPALSAAQYSANQYAILAEHIRDEFSQAKGALATFRATTATASNHDRVARITLSVQERPTTPREDVLSHVKETFASPDAADSQVLQVMCLAASLSTMVRISGTNHGTSAGRPERGVYWKPGTSLRSIASEPFQRSVPDSTREKLIDHRLTMSYLAVYHGYEVIWIHNLNDHLEVDRKLKTVKVFQHKIWLSAHFDAKDLIITPTEAISEALDTLNLLFPHGDRRTESFLAERDQRFYNLGYLRRGRNLDLSCYPIWGNKIRELMDVMKGRRSGLWQFLPSPHQLNILESANFWIAAFVAGLAVISFVFGLFAVIYAKESLDISRESLRLTELQYQLSLAQACSDPESALLLPEWCPKNN